MKENYKILSSNPYPLGVRREGRHIYASMISDTPVCGILLYSSKEEDTLKIPFPAAQHIGHIYFMKLDGIPSHYYGYRLYQEDKVCSDRYGYLYTSHSYGKALCDADMMGIFPAKSFNWENDAKPDLSFSDSVFYGLHVRGFTMGKASKCRHKGTFLGVMEKLPYLEDLGITSLMLMPAYEFIERELPYIPKSDSSCCLEHIYDGHLNYWGYKKAYYYAPKASYACKDACTELKQLVKACHAKNMELFMQFYFTEDIQEPEIIRILEHWTVHYHIDGFQLMAGHININIIKNAPSLAETKLIFHEFPKAERTGHGRHDSAQTTKRLCIYRDDTANDYRRFLKGDEYTLESAIYHFRKNGKYTAYLNSIADYNGFRIADLVSYDYKHNEANGENNCDGSAYNNSWNCGVEGSTKKRSVLQLRTRQIKNALSLILLSQGTPYIFMGDEMAFSQKGNNNPYNQDNDTSWLDWRCLSKNQEIYQFVKKLISYRKEHPILHMNEQLNGADMLGCGFPNISFHALEMYKTAFEPYRRELGILLCGEYTKELYEKADNMLYIACNMHWESHEFALPELKDKSVWHIAVNTSLEEPQILTGQSLHGIKSRKFMSERQKAVRVPPRTIVVLEA